MSDCLSSNQESAVKGDFKVTFEDHCNYSIKDMAEDLANQLGKIVILRSRVDRQGYGFKSHVYITTSNEVTSYLNKEIEEKQVELDDIGCSLVGEDEYSNPVEYSIYGWSQSELKKFVESLKSE